MKKKAIVTFLALGVATYVALGPVMSIFSDKSNEEISVKASNLDIQVSEINTAEANLNKLNPGDGDPDNPLGARPGVPHKFSYKVSSTGNTAVVARNVVTISVMNQAGDTQMDPRNFFLLKESGEKVEDEYLYLSENGVSYQKKAEYTGATPKKMRYILPEYTLSGTGDGADVIDGHAETEQDFAYQIGVSRGIAEEYELASMSMDVMVESIQYRNSKTDDFETLFHTINGN